MLTKRKSILLLSSIIILPLMLLVFHITTKLFGTMRGYFTGFIVYWIYCITFEILLFKNQKQKLVVLFRPNLKSKKMILYSLLTLMPVFGVFFIQFLPHTNSLTLKIILMILINGTLNGFIEELYWRGLYLVEFRTNTWIGLWLSTLLFGAWHIALYSIGGIAYSGFFALVGGATIMGLLWSFCSRKLNNIIFPIIAHSCVNVFAFTGLYIENGF